MDLDAFMQAPPNMISGFAVIKPEWSCGTFAGVHPNTAGYAAMAAFIDPGLIFRDGH
jgi:hypothetical protein